ncbi:MAG: FAD-dependent oxidoreductase [Erysipelothrix sp.]|nr:FAD-dependent oxidoreductase [Erysipelothrix sp.]
MNKKNIVVVGGVAGGMSFATRYRRLNQNDNIIVLDKGPYVSFANCGLPYYISKEIEQRKDLLVTTKEELKAKFNLDVRVEHEVIKINKEEKNIEVKVANKIEIIEYDELVLSLGAKPIYLDIEGSETHGGIFTLRNIPDVDKITDYIDNTKPKSAIVIGAGFIGLEMAESLKNRGLKVSVIEKSKQVLAPLDIEMAKFAENELIDKGVEVYTDTSVIKFDGKKSILEDGTELDADLVIMSIGVLPDTGLLKDAKIALGMRGGIAVDDKFQTSEKHIHAVGDAIIVKNPIDKKDTMIALASPANRQGRQLADILSGLNKSNKGSIGTSIVRIFDLTFASTGLNEKQLDGFDYKVIHLVANDHAGYFPNASSIHLKVIYDNKTRLILGAQGFGKKGVDKRIDILATAIKSNYLVDDLQDLELAYAPPFGSAKDIINMAGYAAENQKLKISQSIQWYELEETLKDAQLVDVRPENVHNAGHITGAINIPLTQLTNRLDEISKDKKVIVSCQTSVTSYNAERILRNLGYDVYNLDGGYSYYSVIVPQGITRS